MSPVHLHLRRAAGGHESHPDPARCRQRLPAFRFLGSGLHHHAGTVPQSEALFCINGSWLENEAKANFSESRTDVIKTPVISSLVNRLSFHDQLGSAAAEEDKLIELIQYVDAVDAGQTPEQPDGVTEDDIRKVTEARHYAYMAGGIDHQAYIPAYSAHLEEAKDFLRFMYSAEGMTTYYQTLSGATLPATPVTAYPEIEMSEFRVSMNQATEEGFVYDREPKARYFVLGKISACFENDVDPVAHCSAGPRGGDHPPQQRGSQRQMGFHPGTSGTELKEDGNDEKNRQDRGTGPGLQPAARLGRRLRPLRNGQPGTVGLEYLRHRQGDPERQDRGPL